MATQLPYQQIDRHQQQVVHTWLSLAPSCASQDEVDVLLSAYPNLVMSGRQPTAVDSARHSVSTSRANPALDNTEQAINAFVAFLQLYESSFFLKRWVLSLLYPVKRYRKKAVELITQQILAQFVFKPETIHSEHLHPCWGWLLEQYENHYWPHLERAQQVLQTYHRHADTFNYYFSLVASGLTIPATQGRVAVYMQRGLSQWQRHHRVAQRLNVEQGQLDGMYIDKANLNGQPALRQQLRAYVEHRDNKSKWPFSWTHFAGWLKGLWDGQEERLKLLACYDYQLLSSRLTQADDGLVVGNTDALAMQLRTSLTQVPEESGIARLGSQLLLVNRHQQALPVPQPACTSHSPNSTEPFMKETPHLSDNQPALGSIELARAQMEPYFIQLKENINHIVNHKMSLPDFNSSLQQAQKDMDVYFRTLQRTAIEGLAPAQVKVIKQKIEALHYQLKTQMSIYGGLASLLVVAQERFNDAIRELSVLQKEPQSAFHQAKMLHLAGLRAARQSFAQLLSKATSVGLEELCQFMYIPRLQRWQDIIRIMPASQDLPSQELYQQAQDGLGIYCNSRTLSPTSALIQAQFADAQSEVDDFAVSLKLHSALLLEQCDDVTRARTVDIEVLTQQLRKSSTELDKARMELKRQWRRSNPACVAQAQAQFAHSWLPLHEKWLMAIDLLTDNMKAAEVELTTDNRLMNREGVSLGRRRIRQLCSLQAWCSSQIIDLRDSTGVVETLARFYQAHFAYRIRKLETQVSLAEAGLSTDECGVSTTDNVTAMEIDSADASMTTTSSSSAESIVVEEAMTGDKNISTGTHAEADISAVDIRAPIECINAAFEQLNMELRQAATSGGGFERHWLQLAKIQAQIATEGAIEGDVKLRYDDNIQFYKKLLSDMDMLLQWYRKALNHLLQHRCDPQHGEKTHYLYRFAKAQQFVVRLLGFAEEYFFAQSPAAPERLAQLHKAIRNRFFASCHKQINAIELVRSQVSERRIILACAAKETTVFLDEQRYAMLHPDFKPFSYFLPKGDNSQTLYARTEQAPLSTRVDMLASGIHDYLYFSACIQASYSALLQAMRRHYQRGMSIGELLDTVKADTHIKQWLKLLEKHNRAFALKFHPDKVGGFDNKDGLKLNDLLDVRPVFQAITDKLRQKIGSSQTFIDERYEVFLGRSALTPVTNRLFGSSFNSARDMLSWVKTYLSKADDTKERFLPTQPLNLEFMFTQLQKIYAQVGEILEVDITGWDESRLIQLANVTQLKADYEKTTDREQKARIEVESIKANQELNWSRSYALLRAARRPDLVDIAELPCEAERGYIIVDNLGLFYFDKKKQVLTSVTSNLAESLEIVNAVLKQFRLPARQFTEPAARWRLTKDPIELLNANLSRPQLRQIEALFRYRPASDDQPLLIKLAAYLMAGKDDLFEDNARHFREQESRQQSLAWIINTALYRHLEDAEDYFSWIEEDEDRCGNKYDDACSSEIERNKRQKMADEELLKVREARQKSEEECRKAREERQKAEQRASAAEARVRELEEMLKRKQQQGQGSEPEQEQRQGKPKEVGQAHHAAVYGVFAPVQAESEDASFTATTSTVLADDGESEVAVGEKTREPVVFSCNLP